MKLTLLCMQIICACSVSMAQQVDLVYRERSLTLSQSALLFIHGQSSTIYLAISRAGVYTLNGPSLTPVLVEGTADADGYEGQYLGDCENGDFLLHQRGFLGDRLFRLDGSGRAQPVSIAEGRITAIYLQGNGSAVADIETATDVYESFVSVDCGQTWFTDSGGRRVQALSGAILLEQTAPFGHRLARPGLGNKTYPSAIKARESYGLRGVALLGTDSVIWISESRKAGTPDTVWYADIRDSSRKRFDTTLQIRGVTDSVALRDMRLLQTQNGLAVLWHRSRWFARYDRGVWTLVDTLPGITDVRLNSTVSIRDNLFQYISNYATGQQFVTVQLDASTNAVRSIVLDPAPKDLWALKGLSPTITSFVWNRSVDPYCLYTEGSGMQLINSVVGEIDVLKATPIQFGFTNEQSEPIVVPYSDCAIRVSEDGVGILKALDVRGEKWTSPTRYGPRIQSTQGLRTPYIGKHEVLSPGDRVRQFTRSGSFVQTLTSTPATSVVRLTDSTVLVAHGSFIKRIRPNGVIDSVDLTAALCTSADSTGYVSSMIENLDGSLVAFVNGMRQLDLETFTSKPFRCGGIIRSVDSGRTWTRSSVPVESPYFLGSVRTSSGALVASLSTLIRDTTVQVSEDEAPPLESKNHTFSDRAVIRSVDNGATWTQVYHAPASLAFVLVGGNGVISNTGDALLMTTNGVLQSTDDGLSWGHREVNGMDGAAQIISLFQDTVGTPVYFCTTTGLYKEQPVTTVQHDHPSPRQHQQAARRWSDHVSSWKRGGVEIKRLITLLGYDVSLDSPPSGLYLVEYANGSGTRFDSILVLPD